MIKETQSAGGVVMNSLGQILVVDQNGDSWSLPKGHLETGESLLDAAQREIYEESGIKRIDLVKTLGSYKRYKIREGGGDDKTELKEIFMFLFTTQELDLNPVDSNNQEARWLNKEHVAPLLTHEKGKEFFLNIIDQL